MSEDDPIVTLPTREWEQNDFSDKNSNSNTLINCQKIGSLAEDILVNVTNLLTQENQLELALSYGMAELKSKYTLL